MPIATEVERGVAKDVEIAMTTQARQPTVRLVFPLFYARRQFVEQEKTLSDLDAAAMTGLYLLLLYFLFTAAP